MTTQTQMCKCGKQYLYVPITLDGEQCHVKVCPDAVDLYVGCEPQDEPQTETDGWIDDLEKKATGRPPDWSIRSARPAMFRLRNVAQSAVAFARMFRL